jgi:hypothetical protein
VVPAPVSVRDEDSLPTIPSPRRAARRSLFQSGIVLRLALAATLAALVWLTIAWALSA